MLNLSSVCRRRFVPIFVFLLGVAVHIESLGYWFTAPDTFALIETSRLTSPMDAWHILTKPLMYGTSYLDIGLFYRPVASLSYAVDYWLWGLNPFGYHLTNVLLHGVAAMLVVTTIRLLTASSRIGILTGVLFAVHPISVDTVPAITRRQDILLAIFGLLTLQLYIKWFRRKGKNQRLRIGVTAAYALALLSKETAIVLGPLVFVWTVFQQPSVHHLRSYWRAMRDLFPLICATVVYLVIRIGVLGGIGGYSRSPSLSVMLLIPVQYVLTLTYPAHAFGALGDVALPLLVAFSIGVPVAHLTLLRRVYSFQELCRRQFLLISVTVVGFVAIAGIVVFPGIVRLVPVDHPHVEWYTVGFVFVLAAISAIVAAWSSAHVSAARNPYLDAFLLVWLVIPLPLFLIGKEFVYRSAYFFVIPLLALLATYLVNILQLFEKERVSLGIGSDTALALAILVLLIPTLAASPLLYTDSGWEAVGDITKQTLSGVDNEVTKVNETTRVVIENIPYRAQYHPKHLGKARERTALHPFSVQSWLRLHGHENPVTVKQTRSFRTFPKDISVTSKRVDGELLVRTHYTRRARHLNDSDRHREMANSRSRGRLGS